MDVKFKIFFSQSEHTMGHVIEIQKCLKRSERMLCKIYGACFCE